MRPRPLGRLHDVHRLAWHRDGGLDRLAQMGRKGGGTAPGRFHRFSALAPWTPHPKKI